MVWQWEHAPLSRALFFAGAVADAALAASSFVTNVCSATSTSKRSVAVSHDGQQNDTPGWLAAISAQSAQYESQSVSWQNDANRGAASPQLAHAALDGLAVVLVAAEAAGGCDGGGGCC